MESSLICTCKRLKPGGALAYVFCGVYPAAAIVVFVVLITGTVRLDNIWVQLALAVFLLHTGGGILLERVSKLTYSECGEILSAAKTESEKALVRKLFCKKQYLTKWDVARLLAHLLKTQRQQQHADMVARMRCAE